MKDLNCSRKVAFDSILRAANVLKWSISEIEESRKVTLESPTTFMANGQRYVFTILDENPCRLVYSLEGKKIGLLQARPSERLAQIQIEQLYVLLEAEIGNTQNDSTDEVETGPPFQNAGEKGTETVGNYTAANPKSRNPSEDALRKVAMLQNQEDNRIKSLAVQLFLAASVFILFILLYQWATKPGACECVERFGKHAIGLYVSQSDFDECEDEYGWYNGSGQKNALHKCYEEKD